MDWSCCLQRAAVGDGWLGPPLFAASFLREMYKYFFFYFGDIAGGLSACLKNGTSTYFESPCIQALYGDCSRRSVVVGNRMAETIGSLVIPIMHWLGIHHVIERPVACPKGERFSFLCCVCTLVRVQLASRGKACVQICQGVQPYVSVAIHLRLSSELRRARLPCCKGLSWPFWRVF